MTPTIQADPAPLQADETGTLLIGGSRVLLEVLVQEYESGAKPESIVRAYPTLHLADVHAAIAYYLRHKRELDDYLQWRYRQAAQLPPQNEGQHAEVEPSGPVVLENGGGRCNDAEGEAKEECPTADFYTPVEYPWSEVQYQADQALEEYIEGPHAHR